jgi:hypothetical protein
MEEILMKQAYGTPPQHIFFRTMSHERKNGEKILQSFSLNYEIL